MGVKPASRLPCRSANASQTGLPTLVDPQSRIGPSLGRRLARGPLTTRSSILTFLCLLVTALIALYQLSGHSVASSPSLRGRPDVLPLSDPVPRAISPGTLMVEFTAPGLMVPLAQALNLHFPQQPEEDAIYHLLPPGGEILPGNASGAGPQVTLGEMLDLYRDWRRRERERELQRRRKQVSARHATRVGNADVAGQPGRHLLADVAETDEDEEYVAQSPPVLGKDVRILIGVTSACCTPKARINRAAARQSWVRRIRETHGDIFDIRFFLAQPENVTVTAHYADLLEEELAEHGDLTILRGRDTYVELPNKTFRLFRYGYAHPNKYTHVMKMDDDCYLRGGELLKALGPRQRRHGSSTSAWDGSGSSRRRRESSTVSSSSSLGPLHRDGNDHEAEGGDPHSADGTYTRHLLREMRKDAAQVDELISEPGPPQYRMTGVYMGCVENWGGYYPIRDPSSKWYVSEEQLPDSAIPFGVKYVAGWGYLLSRDYVERIAWRTNIWHAKPDAAPAWYSLLAWEDVLVGMVLMDVVELPESHRGFRPAWGSCPPYTVVRHLDVDAPSLLKGLYEQEVSGLWEKKQVQCASGLFPLGNYRGWKEWRDNLDGVERL